MGGLRKKIITMNEKFQAKGRVKWSGSNKYNGKTLYSFRLDNQEGFFGCGVADPKVKSGDTIEFSYEVVNGRSSVLLDTISLVSSGPSERPSGNKSHGTSSYPKDGGVPLGNAANYKEKDTYWKDKESRDLVNDEYRRGNDIRIQYQSARNAAIAVTDILVKAGAIIIPEKKGAGAEAIMGKIEDLTNEFFAKCSAVGQTPKVDAEEAA
jgi:hypothetical protein